MDNLRTAYDELFNGYIGEKTTIVVFKLAAFTFLNAVDQGYVFEVKYSYFILLDCYKRLLVESSHIYTASAYLFASRLKIFMSNVAYLYNQNWNTIH